MPNQIFLDKLDRLIDAGQDMKIALHTAVKGKGVVIRIFAPLLVELLFFSVYFYAAYAALPYQCLFT